VKRTRFLLVTGLALLAMAGVAQAATVYNNIPNPLPGNLSSQAFEAQSASEFGGQVQLAGTERQSAVVKAVMSSWACQAGHWTGTNCATTSGATFNVPITLKVYNVGPGNSVGSLITSQTKTFAIPYRPSRNAVCGDGRWSIDGTLAGCFNGFAHQISFDPLGVTLPNNVIVSLAYNTTHYGASPIGEGASCFGTTPGCPYDSLNVGMAGAPTVGTQPIPNDAYLNSSWTGAYCSGAAGTFRLDTGCWTGEQPALRIETPNTADLQTTKSDSPDPVLVGDTLTYTLVAKNNGGSAATGVKVKDTLPSNVTLKSATSTQGSCSGSAPVVCNVGNLADGASATITIKVTPTAKNANTQNTAMIQGNQTDPNTANNSVTISTKVMQAQGSAYGVRLSALLVSLGPTPSVSRSTPGTSSLTSVSANVAGLVNLNALSVSTQIGPGATVNSKAELAKVGLLGSVVAAEGVRASCTATPTSATGATKFLKLVVAGKTITNLNPGPNTSINILGVGTLVLNEQVPSAGGITVNGLHLKVLGGLTDITVSQAKCSIAA
jgi:uncharacterized repeat protein (TIGR01451 family)